MAREDRNYIVYKHTSPSGKVYIGITQQGLKERAKNGLGYTNNPYFWSAICKYKWNNFVSETLFDNLTKEEAERKEIEMIAYYNSTNREYGYNISLGGNSIGKHNEETKLKIGQGNKGKKRTEEQKKILSLAHLNSPHLKGENNPFYGKHHTIESKGRMSKSQKSRDKTTFHHKSVYQIDINTNKVLKIFLSITDASKETGIYDTSIVMACKGKIGQAGGYKWQYVDEPHEYIAKDGHNRKVVQLDIYGIYINTFSSIQEASKNTGVSVSAISRSCNHKTKKHLKYCWIYLDEYEGRVA